MGVDSYRRLHFEFVKDPGQFGIRRRRAPEPDAQFFSDRESAFGKIPDGAIRVLDIYMGAAVPSLPRWDGLIESP